MRRLFLVLILSGSTVWAAQATPQNAPAPASQAKPAPEDSWQIVVPAGTQIPIRLTSSISSRTAYVGQSFYGRTFYPITVRDQIAIPVGTYVRGTITQVKHHGIIRGKSLIRLRCDSLTFPNGVTIRLDSDLSGMGGDGEQALDRKGEPAIKSAGKKVEPGDVRTISETAITGTLVGAVITGSRLGAGMGALGGGLAGVAAVMATRKKEIVLHPGTDLQFQLTKPLTLDLDRLPAPSRYGRGPEMPPPDPGPGT